MTSTRKRGSKSHGRAGAPPGHWGAAEAKLTAGRHGKPGRPGRTGGFLKATLAVGAAIGVLAAIFVANRPSGETKAGEFRFEVGSPGPGDMAPAFRLPSTQGANWELADRRGKNVLLFFQEGLMCQPCWDQLADIEANYDRLRAAGVDEVVSISLDPLEGLKQKVADAGIGTQALSDPVLEVSRKYGTNVYGMHGNTNNGHSFILVGPDGRIRWRADYGGPPDFTMFVPTVNLVSDIRAGIAGER